METKLLVVHIPAAECRRVKGERDGLAWDFWNQPGFVTTSEAYPVKIEVMRHNSPDPYPPGLYLLPAGAIILKAQNGRQDKGPRIVSALNDRIELVPLSEALGDLKALHDAFYKTSPPARAAA